VALMIPQATLQAQLRSRMMVAIGVAQFLDGSVLSAVAVMGWGSGPLGVFLGGTAGLVVGWAGCSLAVGRPRGPASAVRIMPLLRFGLPLLAGGLLFFVVRNADRVIVAGVLSVAELGEYAVAWSMANLLMTLLFLPLQSSLDVWRHRLFLQPGGAAAFADVFRLAMLGMGLAAVGLDTVGVDLLLRVVDGRYASAVTLVPVLSAAVLLQGGYSIVASAFFVAGATGRWTAIFAVGAALQVGVSLACVPRLGLWGAPLGVLAANAWLYGAASLSGPRWWAVPYRHRVMPVVLALVGGVALLRLLAPPLMLPMSLAVDVSACLLSLAVVFALGLLRWQDLDAALELARRRR
jgi:O-antigen/teichoic acid export membrane protein